MKTHMNVLPFIKKTSDFLSFETIKLLVFGHGKIESIFNLQFSVLCMGGIVALQYSYFSIWSCGHIVASMILC